MKKQQKKTSIIEYKRNAYAVGAEALYWLTLLIIIITTLVFSVVLIPLLLVLEPVPLYALVLLLGISFGSIFALLVRDIPGLQFHHHVLALLFLPSISIINLLIVVTVATRAATLLKINLSVNPVFVAVIYSAALLVPYLFTKK